MNTITKTAVVALPLLLLPLGVDAQNDRESFEAYKKRVRTEYNDYKQQKRDEYEVFRRKANEDYANFLKQRWEDLQAFEGKKAPKEPKPPRPAIAPISKIPTSDPIPAVPMPLPAVPPPIVLPNIPDAELPEKKTLRTTLFYGFDLSFNYNADIEQLKVTNPMNGGLGDAWLYLSKRETDALVHDCIEAARLMKLPDWGFLILVRCVAVELVGSKKVGTGKRLVEQLNSREANESVLLEAYILSQSGYRTSFAIGSESEQLKLLVAISEDVYDMTYFEKDGEKYYLIGSKEEKYRSTPGVFDGSKPMTLQMKETPQIGSRAVATNRNYNSKRYPQPRYDDISINRSLVDFYNDYPFFPIRYWGLFSRASLSDGLKRRIYPDLRRAIEGKNKPEAADIIIDFVQQAFEYATDDEQFGRERPLFGDETFYYPYSDCEDRAILYSILVRDLLGLDVLLLHFPGHMGTAVHFEQDVAGDHLTFKGRKFIICDPTYIGATIGMCMPQFKKEGVEIEMLPVF